MPSLSASSLVKLSNGTLIPVVGFGVYQTPAGEARSIVHEALKAGYRHIDSATIYNNEEESGQGIADFLKETPSVKRSDIYYTTKVWNDHHGYEAATKAISASLARVAVLGYIDLILIHSPISNREKRLGTWKALQEAVAAGKVKSIGVSNYGVKHLEELLGWEGLTIKPVINQIELHPWLPRKDITTFAAKHDIAIEAYSPITQGKKLDDPELVLVAKALSEVNGKAISPAQVLIRWSLEQGFIPLPKTVTVSRLATNLDVFDWKFTEEARKALDKDSHEVLTWDPTVYEDPKEEKA